MEAQKFIFLYQLQKTKVTIERICKDRSGKQARKI